MSTRSRALHQSPACSKATNRAASATSAPSESLVRALGEMLSAPSPVLLGKDAAAFRKAHGVKVVRAAFIWCRFEG